MVIVKLAKEVIGAIGEAGVFCVEMFLTSKNEIKRFTKFKKIYTLIVKPNFGCSTKDIYKNFKIFSKPIFKLNKNITINYNFLSHL